MYGEVFFVNSRGERRSLEKHCTFDEAYKVINAFLKEKHYHSYYTRMWESEDRTEIWYDVGSHTEFFVYVKETDNAE